MNVMAIYRQSRSFGQNLANKTGPAGAAKGDPASAIPLFQHAIELDREFASAYAALGRSHQVSGEAILAEEAIRKAYALRHRASEREELDLTAVYYQFATGDIGQAIQSCQLWKQIYPRDFVPHRILGFEYGTLGRWEESAEEFGEAGTRGLFLVVEIERDRWRNGTAGRRLTPCSRVICIRLGITPTLANPADQRRPL